MPYEFIESQNRMRYSVTYGLCGYSQYRDTLPCHLSLRIMSLMKKGKYKVQNETYE